LKHERRWHSSTILDFIQHIEEDQQSVEDSQDNESQQPGITHEQFVVNGQEINEEVILGFW